jgi:hypothetical protein
MRGSMILMISKNKESYQRSPSEKQESIIRINAKVKKLFAPSLDTRVPYDEA